MAHRTHANGTLAKGAAAPRRWYGDRPVRIVTCPHCRGTGDGRPCPVCLGFGWLTAGQVEDMARAAAAAGPLPADRPGSWRAAP